jgi:hypothetical protein
MTGVLFQAEAEIFLFADTHIDSQPMHNAGK